MQQLHRHFQNTKNAKKKHPTYLPCAFAQETSTGYAPRKQRTKKGEHMEFWETVSPPEVRGGRNSQYSNNGNPRVTLVHWLREHDRLEQKDIELQERCLQEKIFQLEIVLIPTRS